MKGSYTSGKILHRGGSTITILCWTFAMNPLGKINPHHRNFWSNCYRKAEINLNFNSQKNHISVLNKATSRKNRRSTYVQFSQCIFRCVSISRTPCVSQSVTMSRLASLNNICQCLTLYD